MNDQTCALTWDGYVDIETGIPLEQLEVGDTVLGLPDPEYPAQPRNAYRVTATLGQHHVPTEDPTALERLLTKLGAERLVAGAKVEGVLVQGAHSPAMFAIEDTPRVDRVIF